MRGRTESNWRALLGRLGKGDVLVVTRLDRLARSTRDLLNLLGAVADKGAGFNHCGIPGPIPPHWQEG